MWHQVGFLADAFSVFKDHGLSIDLVSTSETSVTVTLDPAVNALEPRALQRLVTDLTRICRVEVIGPCAAVSLVGRNIRAVLHRLGDALELFEEHKIYLVTQAANDLNLTFVVDEEQGDRLVRRLHDLTVRHVPADRVLGPTWEQIHGQGPATAPGPSPWWHARRAELIEIATGRGSAYVYERSTLKRSAGELKALKGIDQLLYAIKANPHPEILAGFAEQGLGFEGVSRGEVERVLEAVPAIDGSGSVYAPTRPATSMRGRSRVERVTLDNPHPLRHWGELFRGRDRWCASTRIRGGHHDHVRTAGVH